MSMDPTSEQQKNTKKIGKLQTIAQSRWSLFIAFLVVGPLMLPLVWRSSRIPANLKWLISIVMIGLAVLLFRFGGERLEQGYRHYQEMQQLLNQIE